MTMGTGLRNIGIVPLRSMVGFPGGLLPFDFDPDLVVFTASMAKRAATVFASAPILQGDWAGGDTLADNIAVSLGTAIHNSFRPNLDNQQGTAVLFLTPEFDPNGGTVHSAFTAPGNSFFLNLTFPGDNTLSWRSPVNNGLISVGALGWAAATRHTLASRWAYHRKIDGANYACVSVDDAHTFGTTSSGTLIDPSGTLNIRGRTGTLDSLIEGLTIVRRELYDGTYGVSMTYDATGPVDELAQINTPLDPCLVLNGSWDITFCLPTNATPGALVTGDGEAWSHPHSSNEIPHGWCEDGFYGGEPWAVVFNGTSTTIDCGSAAVLDDIPAGGGIVQAESWFRCDATSGDDVIISKGAGGMTGWGMLVLSTGVVRSSVDLVTADCVADGPATRTVRDSDWHHAVLSYNDTTKSCQTAVDGEWGAADVGVGNYVSDAALNLFIGVLADGGSWFFEGAIGWTRLWGAAHYTPGTDFIPPRAPPAIGAAVEGWLVNEGTGSGPNTIIAQVTTPGNDGDLSSGVWEPQWDQAGTPVEFHGVEFNATTTSGVITDAARIQDLADSNATSGTLTAETWVRADGWGESGGGVIWEKTDVATGWSFYVYNGLGLGGWVETDGVTGASRSGPDEFLPDGKLHHVCMQYDDSGDRKLYLWIDGIPISSYTQQVAATGNATSDIGDDLALGHRLGGALTFDGLFGGWSRVSSILRYTNGEAFAPNDPFNPPGTDANTAWQCDFTMLAGAGFLQDVSAGVNDAILTNYEWLHSFDVTAISPGSGVYGRQGYIVGSNGANDGTIVTFTGLGSGDDKVIRIVGHPGPDSNGHLNVLVYDEIGAAIITDFDLPWYTGTHTGGNNSPVLVAAAGTFSQRQVGAIVWNITDGSFGTINAVSGDGTTVGGALGGGTDNDWDTNDVFRITWAQVGSVGNVVDRYPHNEIFAFELPVGCTSISVTLREMGGDGEWFVHQVELYSTEMDEPSAEAWQGVNPDLPMAWANQGLDAGESRASSVGGGIIHSGADAIEILAGGTADEGMSYTIAATVGRFYSVTAWLYGSGAAAARLAEFGTSEAVLQATLGTQFTRAGNIAAAWLPVGGVARALSASPDFGMTGAGAIVYGDDFSVLEMDNVTLTATPASEANSQEPNGVRIDGWDDAVQPILAGAIGANEGWLRIGVTYRHDIGDARDFGELTPYFFTAWGGALDYIYVRISAANTVQLAFNTTAGGFQQGVWAAAGLLTAANLDTLEVQWNPAQMVLRVDGVQRINVVAPVNFAVVPTQWYAGTDETGAQQVDAVFGPPA